MSGFDLGNISLHKKGKQKVEIFIMVTQFCIKES